MNREFRFSRAWAMPSHETFSVPPIRDFVERYAALSVSSVDPFARNCSFATYTNDLSPDTLAKYHMDAEEFCKLLAKQGVKSDLLIFDPPYSPRQMSECYRSVGLEVGMKGTQSGALYRRVREAMVPLATDDAIALSFGWNSAGFGLKRGFEIIEILLVAHGGGHNDTICVAERRT